MWIKKKKCKISHLHSNMLMSASLLVVLKTTKLQCLFVQTKSKKKKTTHTHYKISKMVKMFQLNHGCKSIADVCSWIEWCNKVKFNCENKASTKKQRLDVLLFYGWSLWFRDFILIFFRFKTPKHVSRGLKQRPGENWKCHE